MKQSVERICNIAQVVSHKSFEYGKSVNGRFLNSVASALLIETGRIMERLDAFEASRMYRIWKWMHRKDKVPIHLKKQEVKVNNV